MPETLEAEIIEIDGKPPPVVDDEPASSFQGARPWTVRLDRRWWPLWILVGAVAVVGGLVFGVLYVVFALIRSVLRLLFGGSASR
ncbi:hypothetical protein [Haloferula sp. A504]|uniref:hypothetical protein n=1 Tax=Haloferula sp. A504 TaxID=3373601 RepID=UPI0031C10F67|nr:hypothetical protein [Verrucomicrobiaceae bacterium E54]